MQTIIFEGQVRYLKMWPEKRIINGRRTLSLCWCFQVRLTPIDLYDFPFTLSKYINITCDLKILKTVHSLSITNDEINICFIYPSNV